MRDDVEGCWWALASAACSVVDRGAPLALRLGFELLQVDFLAHETGGLDQGVDPNLGQLRGEREEDPEVGISRNFPHELGAAMHVARYGGSQAVVEQPLRPPAACVERIPRHQQ